MPRQRLSPAVGTLLSRAGRGVGSSVEDLGYGAAEGADEADKRNDPCSQRDVHESARNGKKEVEACALKGRSPGDPGPRNSKMRAMISTVCRRLFIGSLLPTP